MTPWLPNNHPVASKKTLVARQLQQMHMYVQSVCVCVYVCVYNICTCTYEYTVVRGREG